MILFYYTNKFNGYLEGVCMSRRLSFLPFIIYACEIGKCKLYLCQMLQFTPVCAKLTIINYKSLAYYNKTYIFAHDFPFKGLFLRILRIIKPILLIKNISKNEKVFDDRNRSTCNVHWIHKLFS